MYKAGRKYQGVMMPKGKGSDKRAPKLYLREQREPVQVAPGKVEMQPVSWKFLKEQCEELKDYIAETDESRFLGHVHVEKVEEEKVEEEKVEEEMVEEEVMEEVNEEEVVEEEFDIEEISFEDDHVMEIEDVSDDEN